MSGVLDADDTRATAGGRRVVGVAPPGFVGRRLRPLPTANVGVTPTPLAAAPAAPSASRRVAAIPPEAIIGIVYAVAAALTILVLDRLPQGGDQIKQLLVGDVLAVSPNEVMRIAGVYAAMGIVHWLARRPLLALSFGGEHRIARVWDFVFHF